MLIADVQQSLYVNNEGIFLRQDDLSFHERGVLEDRFWKIRYLINMRENKSESKLYDALKSTYKKFGSIRLEHKKDLSNLEWLEELPQYTNPTELRALIKEKKLLFEKAKKKVDSSTAKNLKKNKSQSDDPEIDLIDQMSEEELKETLKRMLIEKKKDNPK